MATFSFALLVTRTFRPMVTGEAWVLGDARVGLHHQPNHLLVDTDAAEVPPAGVGGGGLGAGGAGRDGAHAPGGRAAGQLTEGGVRRQLLHQPGVQLLVVIISTKTDGGLSDANHKVLVIALRKWLIILCSTRIFAAYAR